MSTLLFDVGIVVPTLSMPFIGRPNHSIKYLVKMYANVSTYLQAPTLTDPPNHLPTYQPTYLPTYLPTNLPIYQPTYQPTYLPTNLPTYLPTYLPNVQLSYRNVPCCQLVKVSFYTYCTKYIPCDVSRYIHW